MKKIIIAIDSFKGCLTSAEAGKAAEKGIKSINPSCHTSVIPIADGGDERFLSEKLFSTEFPVWKA